MKSLAREWGVSEEKIICLRKDKIERHIATIGFELKFENRGLLYIKVLYSVSFLYRFASFHLSVLNDDAGNKCVLKSVPSTQFFHA